MSLNVIVRFRGFLIGESTHQSGMFLFGLSISLMIRQVRIWTFARNPFVAEWRILYLRARVPGYLDQSWFARELLLVL